MKVSDVRPGMFFIQEWDNQVRMSALVISQLIESHDVTTTVMYTFINGITNIMTLYDFGSEEVFSTTRPVRPWTRVA